MSNLTIKPGLFPDVFQIPGSKSHANRLLILASVVNREIILEDVPNSTDVLNLVQALRLTGLHIVQKDHNLVIQNSFPACEAEVKSEEIEIPVGEGGTTGRFLACLLLQGQKTYKLKLGARLAQRPWKEFIDTAKKLGVIAELNENILTLKGPIKNYPPSISVDCSRTTQFATGFQLSMAFLKTKIETINLHSSISYWDLTQDLIRKFKNENRFLVPRDWSSASYPLAFGALTQKILIPNLKYDPLQADSKFYSILKDLGGIYDESSGIQVGPIRNPKSIQINVSDCLDLVPALVFFLAHLSGIHELRGIENLQHKESDRLYEICRILKKFKKRSEISGDALIIHGNPERITRPIHLEVPDDHRIVMSGSLFLLFHAGGSISSMESVAKSFPGFFSQLLKN